MKKIQFYYLYYSYLIAIVPIKLHFAQLPRVLFLSLFSPENYYLDDLTTRNVYFWKNSYIRVFVCVAFFSLKFGHNVFFWSLFCLLKIRRVCSIVAWRRRIKTFDCIKTLLSMFDFVFFHVIDKTKKTLQSLISHNANWACCARRGLINSNRKRFNFTRYEKHGLLLFA